MDSKFKNIAMLSVCFMVLFAAYNTMASMEKTLLASVKQDRPGFNGDGYVSLSIMHSSSAVVMWLAPSAISIIGPRGAMLLGAMGYTMFLASFATEDANVIYVASVIKGMSTALLWTGQGNYLILNSDSDTINQHSAMFCILFQIASTSGNVFVYTAFKNKPRIDILTRQLVVNALVRVAGFASFLMIFLRPAAKKQSDLSSQNDGPLIALSKAWTISTSRNMVILALFFCYNGMNGSFLSGVYTSCVGFTLRMGKNTKELVPLNAIFGGVGAMCGGVSLLFLSKLAMTQRTNIILISTTTCGMAYILILLNLPNESMFGDTLATAFIESRISVSLMCSMMLGFGDSLMTSQIISLLAEMYPNDSAQAVMFSSFVSNILTATSYFYSNYIGLHSQLYILGLIAITGTTAFIIVDKNVSNNNIIAIAETKRLIIQ